MEDRKKAHIDLAFKSRIEVSEADQRFNYEPLLSPHPDESFSPFPFAGKTMRLPIWISSMTGGTALAGQINRNLARAAGEFGLGMGLGSCRILLEDKKYLPDFDVRSHMGNDAPLYANLGIAQLEKMIASHSSHKISEMVHLLRADGIIIHINPLQEAFQPEGDLLKRPPIETLQAFLESTSLRVIVKEVGQGMGPESLRLLLNLPIQAIEFGALGGTNFTKLELARQTDNTRNVYNLFGNIGHTAAQMTQMANNIVENQDHIQRREIIISGGITDVLDGWHLMKSSTLPAVIGMGSAFLKHAMNDYDSLKLYVEQLQKSIALANAYLKIR